MVTSGILNITMRRYIKKVSAIVLAYILMVTGLPVNSVLAEVGDPADGEYTASALQSGYEATTLLTETGDTDTVSPTECHAEKADLFLADSTQKYSFVFDYGQSVAREMLALINELRSGRNAWAYDQTGERIVYKDLPRLSYDYALEKIAMQRAAEIAVLYSSERPDGSSYTSCQFDSVTSVGENILYVKDGCVTAEEAMEIFKEAEAGWSGQTRRRKMLEGSYTAVGVGFASYGGYSLWVQEFGKSVSLSPGGAAIDIEQTVSIDILGSRITELSEFGPDRRYLTLVLGAPADQSLAEHTLPGVTRTLTVAGSPDGIALNTAPSDIIWTTEDLDVARVIGNRVLAVGPGRAALSGSGADWSGDLMVTVVVPATGVKFRTTEIQLTPGGTYQTLYDVTPANAFGYVVSYRSDDPTVAAVDANGVITAVGKGETAIEISITTREIDFVRTAVCYVVVRGSAPQPVDPDDDHPSTLTSKNLIVKQSIIVYSNLKVTKWKTSNKKVATVKKIKNTKKYWRAKVKAKNRGEAVIYGYRGKTLVFKCMINVEKPKFIKDSVRSYDSFYMISRITNVTAANPTKYKSSDPEILYINETTGKIKVKKNGTVNIFVYYGKARYKVKLKVRMPRLYHSIVKIKRGKTKALKIKYKRAETIYEWQTDRPDVAWVEATGKVHAVRCGTARISLWVNGVRYATCKVKVKKK